MIYACTDEQKSHLVTYSWRLFMNHDQKIMCVFKIFDPAQNEALQHILLNIRMKSILDRDSAENSFNSYAIDVARVVLFSEEKHRKTTENIRDAIEYGTLPTTIGQWQTSKHTKQMNWYRSCVCIVQNKWSIAHIKMYDRNDNATVWIVYQPFGVFNRNCLNNN